MIGNLVMMLLSSSAAGNAFCFNDICLPAMNEDEESARANFRQFSSINEDTVSQTRKEVLRLMKYVDLRG